VHHAVAPFFARLHLCEPPRPRLLCLSACSCAPCAPNFRPTHAVGFPISELRSSGFIGVLPTELAMMWALSTMCVHLALHARLSRACPWPTSRICAVWPSWAGHLLHEPPCASAETANRSIRHTHITGTVPTEWGNMSWTETMFALFRATACAERVRRRARVARRHDILGRLSLSRRDLSANSLTGTFPTYLYLQELCAPP
jgi:hypothetical protein